MTTTGYPEDINDRVDAPAAQPRGTWGDGTPRRTGSGSTCDLELYVRAKDRVEELEADVASLNRALHTVEEARGLAERRLAEVMDMLVEEQLARHKAATELAELRANPQGALDIGARLRDLEDSNCETAASQAHLAGALERVSAQIAALEDKLRAASLM